MTGAYKAMIEPNEALQVILGSLKPVNTEMIALSNAYNRIMANSVVSQRTLPPMNCAVLDGYAVKKLDIDAGLRRLKVNGVLPAGSDVINLKTESGTCWRIMTGGLMPVDTDFIIKHELTNNSVTDVVINELPERSGVRIKGDEAAAGDIIDFTGKRLTMSEIAVLASIGIYHISVYRKPRIAVFSTGNEIVDASNQNEPLKVFDSNSIAIATILNEVGCEVDNIGVVCDDPDCIASVLSSLKGYDLIVSTGGSSAGDFDYFARMPEKLGIEWKVFHVRQRPAQPLCYGAVHNTPFFTLPGTPVGAIMCALQYVRPLAKLFAGYSTPNNTCLKAILQEPLDKHAECTQNNLAMYECTSGVAKVYPRSIANYSLKNLVGANAVITINNGRKGIIPAGTEVDLWLI